MALTKVTYVDGETVIGATNLNAIQDEIITNAGNISGLNTNKVDKAEGKGLSTNDYTDAEKTKLAGIQTNANVANVAYDTTNKKITKTINGSTSDVVSAATLKGDMAIGAEDVAFNESTVYVDGSVGKKIKDVENSTSESETYALAAFPQETLTDQSIASFSDGADDIPIKELTVYIEPVQAGTGDPSPENVRPISGHTECIVIKTRKNLGFLSEDNKTNHQYDTCTYANNGVAVTSTGSYGRAGFSIPVKTGETYTVSFKCKRTGSINNLRFTSSISWSTSDYKIYSSGSMTEALTEMSFSFTAITDVLFVGAYPNAVNSTITLEDFQVEVGEFATTFAPYSGTTYDIDFPSEAGTVYGGKLTVNQDGSGTLIIDWAKYVMDGVTNAFNLMSDSGAYKFVTKSNFTVPGYNTTATNEPPTLYCNMYKAKGVGALGNAFISGGLFRACIDPSFEDVASFNTYLQTHNLEYVYKLSNPTSIPLTAEQVGVITTLYGVNNVWADCGDIDLTYRADTQLYIQNLTQPAEDDMIANANIANGTFFMIGNNLYLSTSAIAANEAIVPGTNGNCTQLSLADALNNLNT